MKLAKLMTTTLIAGMMPAFAFAAAHAADPATMTCGDFTGMEAEAQQTAYDALHEASMEAEGDAAAEGDTEMAEGEAEADAEGDTEMAEGDADASAEGDTEMAEGDAAAEGDAEVSEEVQALIDACEGNDDMMAMEAMTASMDG